MLCRRLWPVQSALVVCAGLAGSALLPETVMAQAPAAKKEAEEPPAEQTIELTTRDGVKVVAAYLPPYTPEGSKVPAKDRVPIILLHAWKGSRADFQTLALSLQELGHAVIAPDLRGHGESTQVVDPDARKQKLDAATLRPAEFAAMASPGGEVEQVKQFLLKRNNVGELNIEKLCVVGVEMGASVAINWAALDWSWPELSTLKQGQDVKALVLISPEWTFKGLPINQALAQPPLQSDLSYLIIAGRTGKGMEQAKRLHKQLERFHPLPPKEEQEAKQDLFLDTPKTSLQGTKLLNEKSFKLHEHIATFIELRLVNKRYPWTDRKNPLAN